MSDTAMAPATTSASTSPATTSELATTVPGMRKHAFYVTPEGAAPATTPRFAPLVDPASISDELRSVRKQAVRWGLALFLVGAAATIGTFAVSNAGGGGRFLIAVGPMISGILLMLRGSR